MMTRLVRWLGSLHLAVPLLISIAGVLAWGTMYEQRFGTAAVQRFVYQAWWFQALLGFLAINLAVSALERWPWKRHQAPFLLAHLGIILILAGGIIGGRWGIAGQLIIPEGQAQRTLQLSANVLVVREPNPGIDHVLPTDFDTTAWVQTPHTRYQVPLKDRTIQLVVDRYYPDAQVEDQITNDGDVDNPAIHLRMRHEEQQDDVWLFANDPERFGMRWGEAHVLFLDPDPAQLAGLLGVAQPSEASRGVLSIELPDVKIRRSIPVPDEFSQPVPLEGTPYVLRFKDYFTDFAITEQGIVNRSDQPNNPAIAFTLTGPEGTDAFLAFALHPDFSMTHGGKEHVIHAHAVLTHGAAQMAVPPNSLALIRHPSGALSCVMTGEDGQRHVAPCDVGQSYTHPWLQDTFEILDVYPRARLAQQFMNRSTEIRSEAIHVMAQDGEATAETWLPLRGSAELSLGTTPVILDYHPGLRELPFTIKLLDFRKTDYPGTQMAASFESDVELSDPQRGVILMRTIRMNKPLRYRGFSFFQSSYVPGSQETTVLSARNDPGTPFVYAGFLIVIAGVVSMFVLRKPSPLPSTTEVLA